MATHSNILAWRIPWTEEPVGLQSIGSEESDPTEWLSTHACRQGQSSISRSGVSCSVVSNSVTPWTVACQAPLSMEFFRQKILEWVAIPFSKESFWPRDWSWVACIMYGQILYCLSHQRSPDLFQGIRSSGRCLCMQQWSLVTTKDWESLAKL